MGFCRWFAPLKKQEASTMAAKAIQVELLKQILRLKEGGFSVSAISRTLGLSRPTVIKYLCRLAGTDPALTSEEQLTTAGYNHDPAPHKGERYQRLLQHLQTAEKELKRTGVTRQLLHLEYKEACPDGYNYSEVLLSLPGVPKKQRSGDAPGAQGRGDPDGGFCR
jgi:hypothetical protein